MIKEEYLRMFERKLTSEDTLFVTIRRLGKRVGVCYSIANTSIPCKNDGDVFIRMGSQ